jgi:hypothetical protein
MWRRVVKVPSYAIRSDLLALACSAEVAPFRILTERRHRGSEPVGLDSAGSLQGQDRSVLLEVCGGPGACTGYLCGLPRAH